MVRKAGSAAFEDRHLVYEDRQKEDAISKLLQSCYSLVGRADPGLGMHLKRKADPNRERRFRRYCANRLNNGDMVVFPGGGLFECISLHQYCLMIDVVTKLAAELGMPVFSTPWALCG